MRGRELKRLKIKAHQILGVDAPYAGARIETEIVPILQIAVTMMPLMRGRELKRGNLKVRAESAQDAPYAGARIETILNNETSEVEWDAPYAGARIETDREPVKPWV